MEIKHLISDRDKMTLWELLVGPGDAPASEKPPWFRPFGGSEYVSNPDGSFSTERTVTERLPNNGPIANFPSLWMTGAGPVNLPWQKAAIAAGMYENENGLTFPRFGTYNAGIRHSKEKSAKGGRGGSSAIEAIL